MKSDRTASLERVAAVLAAHRDFLITSHVNPDGDSLGSQLAFQGLLTALGKRAGIINQNAAASTYDFLPDIGTIGVWPHAARPEFTAAVVLDIGEWERMGAVSGLIDRQRHAVINIDHHESNVGFGQAVYVDTNSCSTSFMVYHLYRHLGLPAAAAAATQLYTGILTDTGGFRFGNTSSESLAVCADLVAGGADPAAIMHQVYYAKTALAVRVMGMVLATLEIHAHGRIAAVHLDREILARLAPHTAAEVCANTEGIIDYIRSIHGVEIAIFFREEEDGQIKVSFRANSDRINMNHFAGRHGGGGHPQAAGTHLAPPLAAAKQTIIHEAARLLEQTCKS
jgi:phosphoesterase RecJ-like protein